MLSNLAKIRSNGMQNIPRIEVDKYRVNIINIFDLRMFLNIKNLIKFKNNFVLIVHNIKYPKRYLIKLRYLQRPFFLLQIKRYIFKKKYLNSKSPNYYIALETLFKDGISSYYDKKIKDTLVEISKKYDSLDKNGVESSAGYFSMKLPQNYVDIILPKLLPIADYFFGGKNIAKVRSEPTLNYISRKTVNSSTKESSTDFWHIDTPNQLTMHLFCSDVSLETPHLYYSSGINNKNFIDLFEIKKNKNIFEYYKNLFSHKLKKALGNTGTISIFDPNAMHLDHIPSKSLKPRIYVHINFTPGNI